MALTRDFKETIQARNEADTLIYQVEKSLRELGDKVPAADRGRVEDKIKSLREVMSGDDAGRIRRTMDELQQAAVAIGQAMYAQQQAASGGAQAGPGAGPQGGPGAGPGAGDEEVVEGEFHEV